MLAEQLEGTVSHKGMNLGAPTHSQYGRFTKARNGLTPDARKCLASPTKPQEESEPEQVTGLH